MYACNVFNAEAWSGQVEFVISDPVHLLCVFCQLATQGVETLLGKLKVGGITKTKQKRITGCSIVFHKNVNLACNCKRIMIIFVL